LKGSNHIYTAFLTETATIMLDKAAAHVSWVIFFQSRAKSCQAGHLSFKVFLMFLPSLLAGFAGERRDVMWQDV